MPNMEAVQMLLDDPEYLALADRYQACLSGEVATLFQPFDVPVHNP